MLPSEKRYPRLLPPVFLSPIHEAEEEDHCITTNSDSLDIAEINNSSVIPKQTSAVTTCSTDDTSYVSEDEGPSSKVPEKVVIESCSGRKLEDVEVLKQKYINSEIQDLPRFIAGSVSHNRIWKTRRNNLNLGSQDIRNQLSKLNLKLGSSAGHVDEERQVEYRCKKYNSPRDHSQRMRKSTEDLLNGDFYNGDDYDPELAALFENYIEECDNVTKKHFSEFPTVPDNKNILTKYQMDPDSEHAFLCGFIEGMRQLDNASKSSEASENIVHGSELVDNATKTLANYRDLICRKQDITHMSLREWENVHRPEQDKKIDQRRQRLVTSHITSQKKTPRRVRSNDDNIKVVTPLGTDSKEDVGDSSKTPVAFTEAINALKSMTRAKGHVTGNEKKKAMETEVAHDEVQDETKTVKAARKSSFEDSLPCRYSNKHLSATPNRVKLTPNMREKSVNVNKYRVVDINHLSKEDESIVQLAKKKLEHNMFTSQALEDTYISMVRTRMITNDCKSEGGRKFKNELKGSKSNASQAETKGMIIPFDLDGWTTKNKAFSDIESVHVSSSEILHPVDPFGPPVWTPPAISSPRIPSTGTKTPVSASNSSSKVWSCEASVVKPTEKENKVNDTIDEAKKPSNSKLLNGVMGDYNKAAKHVKLRLTKSYDTVCSNAATPVDKSFVNVPLSHCANYNIEQNLKSSTMLTTNINLSEKLAQQLKDLSNDGKKSNSRHRKNKPKVSSEQNQTSEQKTEASVLLPVSGSSINKSTDRPQSHKASQDNTSSLSEGNTHNTSEPGSIIPRQFGREHSTSDSHSLPHISVTSFPSKPPLEDSKKKIAAKVQEDDDVRGAAVRAGTCISPYTFDKGDPQLLQLKARPFPPFHKVCTSCGGISKNQEDIEESKKRKSTRKENGAMNNGSTKSCCKTNVEDKWKLSDKRCHSLKVFSTGIEKRREACAQDMSKDDDVVTNKPQLMISPTTTKQKCEEMSINFMNKSIKFRFQCDVSVENNDPNEDKSGDRTCQWLNNLSTPSCKDRYQCPVATETRIYKDSVKRCLNERQDNTPQAPVPSPYLDYCKIKADIIAKRKEKLCETTEHLSDTCLANDVYMKAAKKVKRFPVIPIKKSRDSPRTVKGQSSNKNLASSRPNSNCDLFIKSTKPARLPYMKTIPCNISSENINNNVHNCYCSSSDGDISPEQFDI